MRPSTSWFSEASTITRVSRIASRLGSKTASRSATHFGWGVTCTDIGSPPRALELWEKGVLARVSNLAPPCLCTSSCGLITCARSEEHTSELQSRPHLVCRLLLEKKKKKLEQKCTDYVRSSILDRKSGERNGLRYGMVRRVRKYCYMYLCTCRRGVHVRENCAGHV